MGAYLSSPVTDKISCDQTCVGYCYGASSMQGWRISQEDAHNCLPDFDEETSTSLFAVYDGHGGAEVAQYSSIHLPDCIKQTESYKTNKLGQALIDAFLKLDSKLVEESVIKELKELAGEDEEEDEDDDDDPVGRGEADVLRAEADIPLDQILAKYQTSCGAAKSLHKKEVFQSPVEQPRQQGQEEKAKGSLPNSNVVDSSSCSGCTSSESESSSSSGVKLAPDFSDSLINGHAENENNLNKEKELLNTFQAAEENFVGNSQSGVSCSDSTLPSDTVGVTDNSPDTRSTAGAVESANGDKDSTESSVSESGDGSEVLASGASHSSEAYSTLASSGTLREAGCSSSTAAEESVNLSSCSLPGESSAYSAELVEEQEEPGPSGSGCSGHGLGSNNKSSPKAANIDMDDESDDDDDDEEEDWEDDSDEDEDEDGEEEEDDEEADKIGEGDEPMMDISNEEPGSDSGCTACVALIRKNQLVVANAGDSRCVVSRNGKAVDLSFDHKPEDESERLRIEKAGGKVTADGRVNGGLNLSRAIGDHFYKRKEDLPPEEQMITAFPDVQSLTLEPDIEFMVLACDGIWNYMSSQEVVDFVAERLKDPAKRQKLSLICEEMFDHCLAPNTCGDGTGCDNMTCIIVVFDSPLSGGSDCVPPNKRYVSDLESGVGNVEKRPRVDESTDNKDESLNIFCADKAD